MDSIVLYLLYMGELLETIVARQYIPLLWWPVCVLGVKQGSRQKLT
jgi:hypothetical protein